MAPRPHSNAASLFMGPGVKLVEYEEISNNQRKTWRNKDGVCRGNSPGQRATRLALTGCGRQDPSWVGRLSQSQRPWRMAGIRDTVVGTRDPCSQGHRQHGGLTVYPQHSRTSSTNAPNAGLPDAFLSAISDLGGLLSHTQTKPGVTHNEPPRGSFQQ